MNYQNRKDLQRRLGNLDPQSAVAHQNQLKFLQTHLNKNKLNYEIKNYVGDLKTLANENRLKIILALASQDHCICELEFLTGLSQPTISHHVGRLERGGYIITRKDGKWVNVELTDKGTLALEGKVESKLINFISGLNNLKSE